MAQQYDVVVVGDGPGGDYLARRLGKAGMSVAIVEREALGGECLNWGCIPSKMLINIARQRPHLPWVEVLHRMQATVSRIRGPEPDGGFGEDGVTVIKGEASFGPDGPLVDGTRVETRHTVIATGARPTLPPIPGLADANPLTNRTMFTLAAFPERFAVIGGGPIGLEVGQAMSLLGSRVSIFESESIANTEDAPIADAVRARLTADGLTIEEHAEIDRVMRDGGGFFLELSGERQYFDSVLVAAGRAANVPDGFVEAGGALAESGDIQTDDCGFTTLTNTWAIGDVTGGPDFTHHATHQAYHVAEHIRLGRCPGNARPIVPWAIFTTPEIGHAGLTELEARNRYGNPIRVGEVAAESLDWFRIAGEVDGLARVVVREPDGRLLGAHFFCAQGSTLAGEAALAIQHGLTARQVAEAIHPYPTASELFRWACARAIED